MKKLLLLIFTAICLNSQLVIAADSEAIGEELGKKGDKTKETVVTISSGFNDI